MNQIPHRDRLKSFHQFILILFLSQILLLLLLLFWAYFLFVPLPSCPRSVWILLVPLNYILITAIRVGINTRVLVRCRAERGELQREGQARDGLLRVGQRRTRTAINFQSKTTVYGCFHHYFYAGLENEGQLYAYKALLFLLLLFFSAAYFAQELASSCQASTLLQLLFALVNVLIYLVEVEVQACSKDFWEGCPFGFVQISEQAKYRLLASYNNGQRMLAAYLVALVLAICTFVCLDTSVLMSWHHVTRSCCVTVLAIPSLLARLAITLKFQTEDIQNLTFRRIRADELEKYSQSRQRIVRMIPAAYRVSLFLVLYYSYHCFHQLNDTQLLYYYSIIALGLLFDPLENYVLGRKFNYHRILEQDSQLQCPICFDPDRRTRVIQLVCSHRFHEECFRKSQVSRPLCPLCRADFSHI